MFKLPQEVKKGLKDYRSSLKELLEERLTAARFKGVRVPWGIYNQRGGQVFMTRIRIPAGTVDSAQLKALAHMSGEFASGLLHITTRQDIQIHDVEIQDTIKVMDKLGEYNLSPRGGGGNTVRNIIACSFSGICKEENFDVRGYAISLSEYLLRQDTSFALPRKFKISFSGCSKDCAGVAINDLGFLAQRRDGKLGFSVFVSGGMGADSRVGTLLEEFVPEEDLGYCVLSVKNIFYKKGNRKNKHHNRLRFLIYDDLGFEEFKKLYKQEFKELKEKEHIVLRNVKFNYRKAKEEEIPASDDKEYQEFLNYNVWPQRQKGFFIVRLRIPRGDLFWQKLTSLAELEKDFSGIQFATTQNQNLAITWIKAKDLHPLFLKLKQILSDFLYPDTLLDVVACKGALTCNLGLCNSPGLTKEIEKIIKKDFIGTKIFKKLSIKINGCPNACGQHPIGNIALHGVVKRVDNRPVPFYKLLLGGRREIDKTKLAEQVALVPARNILLFLQDFLKRVDEELKEDEDIYEFLEERGRACAEEIIKDYSYVPSHAEDRNFYIDWGKSEEFSLVGIGPGECGAGVLDMIESDLLEAKISIDEAEKKDYAPQDIKKALFLSSRCLLVVKGVDPKAPDEAFIEFKKKFIDEGIASSDYSNIADVYVSINDDLELKKRQERFDYTKQFLEHINSIYKGMDSSFSFPKLKKEKQKTEEEKPARFIDLKGTPCPMNYVKAKLVLENLNSGDLLEIILDEGAPVENVPRSLKDDGHEVLAIEKQGEFYKLTVKKK